jgi:peptidoglycan/xylan/chitin deacetylase (PgdA/CDA1 family)
MRSSRLVGGGTIVLGATVRQGPSDPARSAGPRRRPKARTTGVLLLALLLGAGNVAPLVASNGDDVISRVSVKQPTVALTFDDGSNPGRCLRIATILDRAHIPATWFPNGVHVQDSPEVWRRIARRFPLANHTTHHLSLVGLSRRRIRREIVGDERIVERVTGQPMLPFLRPPFGAYDRRVQRIARSLGYRLVLWSPSAADTSPHGTDWGIARRAASGGPGSIILMHCGPEVTPRILPVVIARYACAGYRFADLDKLLAGGRGVKAHVSCPPPRIPNPWKRPPDRSARDSKPPGDERGPAATPRPSDASHEGGVGQASLEGQALSWGDCVRGTDECASLELPLAGARTDAGAVTVTISRTQATGDRLGAIVLAPDDTLTGTVYAGFVESIRRAVLPRFDVVRFWPPPVHTSASAVSRDVMILGSALREEQLTGREGPPRTHHRPAEKGR